MSKTKDKAIDQQNAEKAQTGNALAALIAADSSVTDKAAVVEGYMFDSTQTPPVVYVQGEKRAVCVAPTEAEASELCETVKNSIIAGNRTATVTGCYGSEAGTGKVWYEITTNPLIQ